eukprot:g1637.t1
MQRLSLFQSFINDDDSGPILSSSRHKYVHNKPPESITKEFRKFLIASSKLVSHLRSTSQVVAIVTPSSFLFASDTTTESDRIALSAETYAKIITWAKNLLNGDLMLETEHNNSLLQDTSHTGIQSEPGERIRTLTPASRRLISSILATLRLEFIALKSRVEKNKLLHMQLRTTTSVTPKRTSTHEFAMNTVSRKRRLLFKSPPPPSLIEVSDIDTLSAIPSIFNRYHERARRQYLHTRKQQLEAKDDEEKKNKEQHNPFATLFSNAMNQKRVDSSSTKSLESSKNDSQLDNVKSRSAIAQDKNFKSTTKVTNVRNKKTATSQLAFALSKARLDEETRLQSQAQVLKKKLDGNQNEGIVQTAQKMAEVQSLVKMFIEKVSEQSVVIDNLMDITFDSVDFVERGKESLRKADEREGTWSLSYLVIFILIMSFTLLFLDWFTP